ncbi:MAG: sulfatase-like hydrolase/transferase [Bacteroidales bacterium]
MNRNIFLSIVSSVFVALSMVLFSTGTLASGKSEEIKLPNFVLIVIDDLGYGDLGIYGNKVHHTPNIDKLAKNGLLFTDFHSNGPVCSPTRAALMTGQYQQRSGIESAIGFNKEEGMPLEKITIAELLHEKGYQSGVFGKWHLGHVELFGPNEQGFNQSTVSNNTPDYYTHISRIGEYDWYTNHIVNKEDGYLTDLVTKHSTDFIKKNRNHPFFLFISHIAVHFPFQGPNDPPLRTPGKIWHDNKYGPLPESQYRRAYAEMLEEVDKSIGKVTSALEESGLRDNTLIFITSDNGAYSWVGSNYPYRGEKGELFEGGHRIPAIANWPGQIEAGKVTNALTMTMDIAPTFASLAGLVDLENISFDGIDFSSVFDRDENFPERILFWRFNNSYTNTKAFAVRKGQWKYSEKGGNRYLFNLNQDPTESNNLINIYNKEAEQLRSKYQEWINDIEN